MSRGHLPETISAFSLLPGDDPDGLALARLVVESFLLLSIRASLDRIEWASPALVNDALAGCRERLTSEGNGFDLRVAAYPHKLSKQIAAMTGCDADLAALVFTPTKAGIVSDELKRFITRKQISTGRPRR